MIIADLAALLLLATLVGMALSGRIQLCRSFALYLAVVVVVNRLIRWWPEQFYTSRFFTGKELVYAGLSIAIVIELAWSGLASFPRARRISLALVSVVTLGFVVAAVRTFGANDYATQIGVVVGGAQSFALAALVVFLAVAQWYRLPLRPWHRAIAIGFLLYRGVYGVLLGALAHWGGPVYAFVAELDRAAYAVTVGLWGFAAWRTEWHDLTAEARLRARALQRS